MDLDEWYITCITPDRDSLYITDNMGLLDLVKILTDMAIRKAVKT